jgi:hypothetical protein
MKVFISWSGNMSREIGGVLRDWLPKVLQFIKPYFSEVDIGKGEQWLKNINKELKDTTAGIVCLTPDNINSPWLMFEAGAIFNKTSDTLICPILFNLKKIQISGPLSQFQLTEFKNREIKKLIEGLNKLGGEKKLSADLINETFNKWWQDDLKKKVDDIIKKYEDLPPPKIRSDRDVLEEVLTLVRSISRSETVDEKVDEKVKKRNDDKISSLMETLKRKIVSIEDIKVENGNI